jgi:hypothetical protein
MRARSMLADEGREQRDQPLAAGSYPQTATSDLCRKALDDPAYTACESLEAQIGDSRCRVLVDKVCGAGGECAKAQPCDAAHQLLRMETEERLANDNPGAITDTGRQRLGLGLAEPVFCWTLTDGLRRVEYQTSPQRHLAEPAEALKHVKATSQSGIYLLLDFHPFLDHPLHVRLLKEIGQSFDEVARRLVLVSHALETPPELRHLSARFALHLPDRNRILALIREEAQQWQQAAPNTQRHRQGRRHYRDRRRGGHQGQIRTAEPGGSSLV